jgi:hypothetical protein
MKRLVSALLVALVCFGIGPAWAADKPQPQLVLEDVQAMAFEKLTTSEKAYKYGVAETMAAENTVLLGIGVTVIPQWTDQIDKANVDHKNITVVTDGGKEILMLGYLERYGQFRMSTNNFYAYRPNNWKEKPKKFFFNAIFGVPAGTKSVEFKLGDASAKVKMPDKTSPPLDSGETVKVEVLSAKMVQDVKSTERVGDLVPKPIVSYLNPNGGILEVHLKITPTKGNGYDPDHFFWYTPWFGLVTDNGAFVSTFGEIFMEKVNNSVSHNLNRSQGSFSSGEAKLYFAVGKDIKNYKLIFVDAVVAEGAI